MRNSRRIILVQARFDLAVKSSTILRIVPKKLVGDLSPEEKEQNPLLLDVTLKPAGRQSSSYQLNAIFQRVKISVAL